jgi:hypothetical protein
VLPPFSTLVDPDGIEEELAHEVRLSSTDPYPVSQLSEQNMSATNDVESGDDPAELGSVSDGNSVRDSHDDPRRFDVNDYQLETISKGVWCLSNHLELNGMMQTIIVWCLSNHLELKGMMQTCGYSWLQLMDLSTVVVSGT